MKILIVKLAAIGDVIMSTTMLKAIEEKYGESEVTWICGKSVYPILSHYPIQELITVNESKLLMGSTLEKIKTVVSLWKKIMGKSFDLIITAHSDTRYSLLTLPIKANKKVYFNQLDDRKIPIPGRYHGDEYARLVLGADDVAMKHWYPLEFPRFIAKPIKELCGRNIKAVVLAPGGAKNIMRDDGCRRWPITYYVELAEKLISKGYTVAITGASSDAWVKPYFSKISVIDFVGGTSLIELLNVFSQADIVVTHDSGPLHLAILAKANIIGLFGPTLPDEKVPFAPNIHVLWNKNHLPCCPCYDGRSYAKCKDNRCLRQIMPENVLEKIREIERTRNYCSKQTDC